MQMCLARFALLRPHMTTAHALRTASREVAPWIERLARAGYAAKGVVYGVFGMLAVAAAMQQRATPDRNDAFIAILRQPLGRGVLALIVTGLAGYALWRLIGGFADWERRGDHAKGIAIRATSVARGLFYAVIAIEVARLAISGVRTSGSDEQTRHWIARAMDQPLGRWIVAATAVSIAAYGIYQLYAAATAKLSRHLRLSAAPPNMRRPIIAVSRFGIAARGVVFALVGLSIARAALRFDPQAARGTAGALGDIARQPFGDLLLLATGLGFVAYGAYALINARYRTIPTS